MAVGISNNTTDQLDMQTSNITGASSGAYRLSIFSQVYVAFLFPLAIFGITANLILVCVPLVKSKLRTKNNFLIANLAFVDCCICSLVVCSSIYYQLTGSPSLTLCALSATIMHALTLHSIHIQCFIAYGRYKLISTPPALSDEVITWKVFLLANSVLSIIDIAILCFPFVSGLSTGPYSYEPAIGICRFSASTIVSFVLSRCYYLIIIIIALVWYRKLFAHIRKYSITLELQKRRQARLSVKLCCLFLTWVVAFLITAVLRGLINFGVEIPDAVFQTAYFLLWFKSSVNPFIYNFKGCPTMCRKFCPCCGRKTAPATASIPVADPVIELNHHGSSGAENHGHTTGEIGNSNC